MKRDSTPPPSSRLLIKLYGDATWAPVRLVKKKRLGLVVAIPFVLEEDDEVEEKEEKMREEVDLATGDSPGVNLERLSLTPPPNTIFLRRQYGDLTHAPSSDRSTPRLAFRSSNLRPARLHFEEE